MLSCLRPLVLVPFIALLGCHSAHDAGSDASVETDALVMDAVVMDAGSDSDGSIDTSCVVTAEVHDVAGVLQRRTRLTYDDSHRVTTAEYDDDADGNAEHVHSYTYDEDGNVSTVVYDDVAEDEDILLSHVYDVDGTLTRVDVSGVERVVGFDYMYETGQLAAVLADPLTTEVNLTYEAREQVSRCDVHLGRGSGRYSTYGYDTEGNRLIADSFDYTPEVQDYPLSRSTMTYDSEGNPLTEDVHNIEYSVRWEVEVEVRELLIHRNWTHDAAGNVLTRETDRDGDGSVDQHTAWTYECGSLPASALPVPNRIPTPYPGGMFAFGYLVSFCPADPGW